MSTPHPQKSLNSGLIIDEIGLYFNDITLPPAGQNLFEKRFRHLQKLFIGITSIHPLVSAYLLELFNDTGKNPNNGQLIAATHDVSLLDPKTLRRDQIWFTAKNSYGATDIFSLDEFDKNEVRKNTPFDKWYLTGRFGALPLIDKKRFSIDKKRK